jgi:hypothetical protein
MYVYLEFSRLLLKARNCKQILPRLSLRGWEQP